LNVFLLGGEFSAKGRNDYDEFGAEDPSKKTRKKKKGKNASGKSNEAADDWGSLSGNGITGKLPRRVNKITLRVGCSSL